MVLLSWMEHDVKINMECDEIIYHHGNIEWEFDVDTDGDDFTFTFYDLNDDEGDEVLVFNVTYVGKLEEEDLSGEAWGSRFIHKSVYYFVEDVIINKVSVNVTGENADNINRLLDWCYDTIKNKIDFTVQ